MKRRIVLLGIIGCLAIASGIAVFVHWKNHEQQLTTVTIASDGSLYLADERLDTGRLSAILKKRAANRQAVSISADKKAPLKRIVEVMDVCRVAGVKIAPATTQ